MDSMSRIYFTYTLNNEQDIDPLAIQKGSFRAVFGIEGHLNIFINNKLFFSEPYIALLDLALSLNRWSNEVKLTKENSFHYQPIDHDEAILHIVKRKDNHWYIYSQWQKFEASNPIHLQMLIQNIDGFLRDVQIKLYNRYEIKVANYLYG